MIPTIILLLFSFLCGSIPFAFIISKLFYGIDIRTKGSGNPGATNVWRVVGKKPAAATFALDVLKGLIPVLAAEQYFPDAGLAVPIACGFCAAAGHIWTPFLKFRGGKGVATGFGIFLGLAPLPVSFSFAIFCLLLFSTKMVAVGSIGAAVSLPLFLFLFKAQKNIIAISILLAIIVVWRHKQNIKNIMAKKYD